MSNFLMRPTSLQFDCVSPSRTCSCCGEIKSLVEYTLTKDQIYPYCEECKRKYANEYSKTDKLKQYRKEYRSGENWKLKANQYQRTHRAKKKLNQPPK